MRRLAAKEPAGARDRPAGPERQKKVGDRAVGLPPDLRARGPDVGEDILLVLVLVGHDVAIARGLGVGLGQVDRAFAHPRRGAQLVVHHVQLGAGDLEQDLLLKGHLVGHHRPHVMAAGPGHGREADPGVARGGLDDAPAVADLPAALEVAQHRPGRPVLDRAEGVHPLQLGVEDEVRRGVHPVDPHHRRGVLLAGQKLEDAVVDAGPVIHDASKPISPGRFPCGHFER